MENFRLGSCSVIPALNQIRFGRRIVHVQPKAMRLLQVLVAKPRHVVSREELAEKVWDNRFPTDEVIARTVASLRKSLGDDSREPRYVETIPKQGYRLIAPVSYPGIAGRSRRWSIALAGTALGVTLAAIAWMRVPDLPPTPALPDFELTAQIAVGLSGYEEAPALDASGDRVLFSYSQRDSSLHRIYLADLSGPVEGPRALGQEGFDDRYPVWSPAGDELALIRRGGEGSCSLVRIGLATGTERLITECGASIITPIDWSPDGGRIAYSDRDPQAPGHRIHTVSPDGSDRRPLTDPSSTGRSDWWPRYSPDGRWIAHVRGNLFVQEIHLTPADGGETIRWGGGGEGFLYGITWLEDGSGVVYAFRGQDDVFSLWHLAMGESAPTPLGGRNWALPAIAGNRFSAVRLNHDFDVYRVDLARGQTQSIGSFFDSSGIEDYPALSPDGSQAALISNRSGTRALWLTIVSNESSPASRELLRPEFGRLQSPAWALHGDRLAVIESSSGRSAIWVLELSDHTARKVYDGIEHVAGISWGIDDRSLLFGSDRSGLWQIYRLDLLDQSIAAVTVRGGYRGMESLDGRWLYYMDYLNDGLRRLSIDSPERDEQVLAEVKWLDRENWFVTERGVIVPLESTEKRPAGLYRWIEGTTVDLITEASLYQSVKPDQAVAVSRDGGTAVIVRPAFYQGNIVLVSVDQLPIPSL